jgi:hypothetical protein
MAEGRVYKVTNTPVKDGTAVVTRLIRAGTQSQAIRHVVKDSVRCEVATIDDAVALTKVGIEIEDATSEPDDTPE